MIANLQLLMFKSILRYGNWRVSNRNDMIHANMISSHDRMLLTVYHDLCVMSRDTKILSWLWRAYDMKSMTSQSIPKSISYNRSLFIYECMPSCVMSYDMINSLKSNSEWRTLFNDNAYPQCMHDHIRMASFLAIWKNEIYPLVKSLIISYDTSHNILKDMNVPSMFQLYAMMCMICKWTLTGCFVCDNIVHNKSLLKYKTNIISRDINNYVCDTLEKKTIKVTAAEQTNKSVAHAHPLDFDLITMKTVPDVGQSQCHHPEQ